MPSDIYLPLEVDAAVVEVAGQCYQLVSPSYHAIEAPGYIDIYGFDNCCDCWVPPCFCWSKWKSTYTCPTGDGDGSWSTPELCDSPVCLTDENAAILGREASNWAQDLSLDSSGCTYSTVVKGSTPFDDSSSACSASGDQPSAPDFTPDCCPAPCTCPCSSGGWGTWPCSGLNQTYHLEFDYTYTSYPYSSDCSGTPTVCSGHVCIPVCASAGLCSWWHGDYTDSPCGILFGQIGFSLNTGSCKWQVQFNFFNFTGTRIVSKTTGLTPVGSYGSYNLSCYNPGGGTSFTVSMTNIKVVV
jgi:hypothetical protein